MMNTQKAPTAKRAIRITTAPAHASRPQLTPDNTILLDKLIFAQLAKKFYAPLEPEGLLQDLSLDPILGRKDLVNTPNAYP